MRTRMNAVCAVVLVLLATVWTASAEKPRNLTVENSLRLGFDDNVYLSSSNEEDSFRITDELALTGDLRLENTYLSLRYRAGLTWYDNRPDNDTEWSHQVNFLWNQTLSRRFSLGVLDAFSYQDRPELINEDGTIRRSDSSYAYNSLNATLATILSAKTRLDLSGRSQMLRYDEERLAEVEDYDIYGAGATLRSQVAKETAAFMDLRYESLEYTDSASLALSPVLLPGSAEVSQVTVPDRGADTTSAGAGVEHTFNPNLIGMARAGLTYKEYDAANSDNDSAPYGELSLTMLPSPATRVTLGAAYSLFQSSVSTYANQERTALTLKVGHDLAAKVQVSVAASFVNSDYEAADTVDTVAEDTATDGNEEALTLATRLTYRVNRTNWLEAGWSLSDLSSDVRSDYQRNIYDIAWRVRL